MLQIRRIAAGVLIGALTVAGCSDDSGGALPTKSAGPASPPGPTNAEDLVLRLYGAIAGNDAATACALFSPSGQAELVDGTGMPSCEAAVDSIAQQVADPAAFAHPTIEIDDPGAAELDEWCSTGIHVDIPDGALTDPGAVAAFAYTRQPDNTWQVTAYNTTSCG